MELALAAQTLDMQIKFEVVHIHTLIALVAAGIEVGILPKVPVPVPLKKTMQASAIVNPSLVRLVGIITLKGHRALQRCVS